MWIHRKQLGLMPELLKQSVAAIKSVGTDSLETGKAKEFRKEIFFRVSI